MNEVERLRALVAAMRELGVKHVKLGAGASPAAGAATVGLGIGINHEWTSEIEISLYLEGEVPREER